MKIHFENSIISIANVIASKKSITKKSVIKILEDAVALVIKSKYNINSTIKTIYSPLNETFKIYREFVIVKSELLYDFNIFYLSKKLKANFSQKLLFSRSLKAGDIVRQFLPYISITRNNFLFIKYFVTHKIFLLEKNKIINEYQNKVGQILCGVIEKVEASGYIINFGNISSMLKRSQVLKTDFYQLGDRIKVYLQRMQKGTTGLKLILSRKHKNFVRELLKNSVEEIYNKSITIKCISREAGILTKVAISSNNNLIDSISSYKNFSNIKIQSVLKELDGENIDMIEWSPDPAQLIMNALGPSIKVTRIIFDDTQKKVEIIIPKKYKSRVIGFKGMNVKLISSLLGWDINVISDEVEMQRRRKEFESLVEFFARTLNIEEVLAQLLVSNGFKTISSVCNFPQISNLENIDINTAKELSIRAREYCSNKIVA